MKQPTDKSLDTLRRDHRAATAGARASHVFDDAAELSQRLDPTEPVFCFSAEALRDRILDVGAKLVVTADGGYRRGAAYALKPAVDEALRGETPVKHVVMVRRTGEQTNFVEGRDLWWHDAIEKETKNLKDRFNEIFQ